MVRTSPLSSNTTQHSTAPRGHCAGHHIPGLISVPTRSLHLLTPFPHLLHAPPPPLATTTPFSASRSWFSVCGLDPTEKRGRVLSALVWLLSLTLQPPRSIRHHKMAARPPFSRPSGTHRARVSAPPLYPLCSQARRGPRRGYCEERCGDRAAADTWLSRC